MSTSPLNDDNFELINNIQQQQQQQQDEAAVTSKDRLASESEDPNAPTARVVRNSPSDNVDNIFMSEKQPQWFIGRVLVKEFCVARKVSPSNSLSLFTYKFIDYKLMKNKDFFSEAFKETKILVLLKLI